MRTSDIDFSLALRHSESLSAFGAVVISVVLILLLTQLFKKILIPWVHDFHELHVFLLPCGNVLRKHTEDNNDEGYP